MSDDDRVEETSTSVSSQATPDSDEVVEYSDVVEQPADLRDEELDFHASSGASTEADAFIDEEAPTRAGPEASNQTTFRPEESTDPQRFDELRETNAGRNWKGREKTKRIERRILDVETFCERIGIVGVKRDWIKMSVRSTDLSEYGNPRSENALLAIITLVINQYDEEIRPESGVSSDDDHRVKAYKQLRDEVGAEKGKIRELRDRLRHEV